MPKINKTWVVFSLIFWLFCCQGLFILVQRSAGEKIVASVQNQMRQELNFSDFHFLARSISDYTISKAIKCTILEKIKPEFIPIVDLTYMENSCHSVAFFLNGNPFDIELKTLNGDSYRLRFISNNSYLFYLALWGFRILGIILVLTVVWAIALKMQKDMLKYQLELDFANKVKDIAMQVSHDIRSPLMALKVAIDEVQIEEVQYKKIIKGALERIDGIANNLLGKNAGSSEHSLSDEYLIPLIESIIFEKKIEFKKNENILIELNLSQASEQLVVRVNPAEFRRVLSNLINNAVEAISPETSGRILVVINATDIDWVIVSIVDNGKGVPNSLLERLGEKGFSHGKEKNKQSGSGLGLNHAKEMIQRIGGKFEISSIEGEGMKIDLSFPLRHSVNITNETSSFYDCVLIDNDELVRITWQIKAKRKKIRFLALKSIKEFGEVQSKINKITTAIYIDSELGDTEMPGEEFAEILYRKGYVNLTMTTGHGQDKFASRPWLKHRGKDSPF